MPRRVLLTVVLALLVAGCGGGDEKQSSREAQAETLVELRVDEDVSCKDNGAVNTELHPDHLVTYICRNEDDEIYAATVTPDGELTSLSGPAKLKPASS